MSSQQIATTILEQLGGNRFLAMTGARDLVATGKGLRFRIPRGMATNKATHCHIELNGNDEYTMSFMSVRGITVKQLEAIDGVCDENVREIFTNHTGLDCSLGTCKG